MKLNEVPDNQPRSRHPIDRRRVAVAVTVVSLCVAALVIDFDVSPYPAALAQNLSEQAHPLRAPIGFADIVAEVKPAVVSVRVKIDDGPATTGLDEGRQEFRHLPGRPGETPRRRNDNIILGQGSGFFISADGYAVTNNHVVENAESVQVTTDDGKTHTAKVIGTDPRTDLALIKVDDGPFPYVKLSDKSPRIGDWVLAVGNPFGLGGTVTAGIISARGREIGASAYDDFIQIDAPVNKGNSGGPTFDTDGNVIGVNTAIYSPSGGSVGIAFAIPSSTVRTVVAQLKDHGAVTRGWIGIQIQPLTQDIADSLGLKKAEGALVAESQPNSPAQKAGIEPGDVITAVDGKAVKDARDLTKKIGALAPTTTIKLAVVRNGSDKTISLTLDEMPTAKKVRANSENTDRNADVGTLGLEFAPAGRVPGAGTEGVVITGVDSTGIAADHGLSTGDVILQIAGKSVSTPSDVRNIVATARTEGKRTVLIRLKSGDITRFVALPLSQG